MQHLFCVERSSRAVLLTVLAVAVPAAAFAIGEVSSPNITKGKLSAEYGLVRTIDDAHEKNKITTHELEVKYGLTDRLRPEIKLEFEDARGDSTKVDAFEVGAQYQLFARGANWMDSAVKLSYAHKPYSAEAIKAKLLLEKRHGKFTHRSNINLSQDVGRDAHAGGLDYSIQWSSRYNVAEKLALGFEVDTDLGQWRDFGDSDTQKHYAGPSVYGDIGNGFNYEVAYFFGLNDAAADGAALFILEYGLKF
jgi:hypothetical protein